MRFVALARTPAGTSAQNRPQRHQFFLSPGRREREDSQAAAHGLTAMRNQSSSALITAAGKLWERELSAFPAGVC
jgi:hypothetical protein